MGRVRKTCMLLLLLTALTTVKALVGSVEPSKAVIEVGSNITLNCVLDVSSNNGRTAHNAVWEHPTNPLPPDSFIVVNNTLSQLSLTNVTFSDKGFYYCLFPGDSVWERGASSVNVGIKPKPPLVECFIPNPEEYWCRWEIATLTNLRTTHNFTFKFNEKWRECPDRPDRPRSNSKGENTCLITLEDIVGYTHMVRVESTNDLGSAITEKTFHLFTDVKVNPPQDVQVISISETSLRVEWDFPDEWYQTGLLDYKLRHMYVEDDCTMANATCCCWTVVNLGRNVDLLTHTLNNLHPYSVYKVQVAARFENNWSEWSPEQSARTLHTLPSAAVENLQIKEDSHPADSSLRNVQIFWKALNRTQLNGQLVGYLITVRRGQSDVQHNMTGPNQSWFPIPGLGKFYGYTIRVAAVNGAGEGPSSEVQLHDLTMTPNAPDEVTAVAKTTTSIEVKWKMPTQPNGFIEGYQIEWGRKNKDKLSHITTITSHVLEGLESFALYDIGVRTQNLRGFSGLRSVSARTLEGVPDVAPNNLEAKSIENYPDQLAVSWRQLPPDSVNGNLTGYQISFCESASYTDGVSRKCADEQPLRKNVTHPNTHSDTLTGLKPSTTYSMWIAAYTGAGRGPESQPVEGMTVADPRGALLRNIFIPIGVVSVLVAVFIFVVVKYRHVLQPFPGPKYASSIDLLKNGCHNLSRSSSRIEGEHFDEILSSSNDIKIHPWDVKSCEVGEEALQTSASLIESVILDPKAQTVKFMRSESRDSGVPPSPAGDSHDFGSLRDKRGSSSEDDGDDSVFMEDEVLSRNEPKKLRVRIDAVNKARQQSIGSPSSPIDTVGPYTMIGQIPHQNFQSRSSASSPVKSPKKVSFKIPPGNNGATPGAKISNQQPSCGSRNGSVSSPTDVSPYTLMTALGSLPCRVQEAQQPRQPSLGVVVPVPSTSSPVVSPYTQMSALAPLQVNTQRPERPSSDACKSPTSPSVSPYTKMSEMTSLRCSQPNALQQERSPTSASTSPDPINPPIFPHTQMSNIASLNSNQAKVHQQSEASSSPSQTNSPVLSYTHMLDQTKEGRNTISSSLNPATPVSPYTQMTNVVSLQSKQAQTRQLKQPTDASKTPDSAISPVSPYTQMPALESLQSNQAQTRQLEPPTGASTTPDCAISPVSPYTQMPTLNASQPKQADHHLEQVPTDSYVSANTQMQAHQQKPKMSVPRRLNPTCPSISRYIQTPETKGGMSREQTSTRRSGRSNQTDLSLSEHFAASRPPELVSPYIPIPQVEEMEPRRSKTAQPVAFPEATPTEVSRTNSEQDSSIALDDNPYATSEVDPREAPSTNLHPSGPGPDLENGSSSHFLQDIQESPRTEFESEDESHSYAQMSAAGSNIPPFRSDASDLGLTLAVTDYTQIGITDNPLSGSSLELHSFSSYEDSSSSWDDAPMSTANETSSDDAESLTSQPGSGQPSSQDRLGRIYVDSDSEMSDDDQNDVSQHKQPSLSGYVKVAESSALTGQNGITFPQRNSAEAGVGVPVTQPVSDYVVAGSWPSHNTNSLV